MHPAPVPASVERPQASAPSDDQVDGLLPPWPQAWLTVLALGLVALLLRGFSVFGYPYPSGSDYGQTVLQAELFLEQGRLPAAVPYFQLGQTDWAPMPGSALLYGGLAALAGRPVIDLLPLMLIFALVEVGGVYMLAWRAFRRLDAAAIAAGVVAVLPAAPEMMAWSGYPNLMALALIPVTLAGWLACWQRPTRQRLLLTVLLVCGTVSLHHVSALWLVLSLGLFALVQMVRQPVRSLARLAPLLMGGLVVGFPIAWHIANVYVASGIVDVLYAPGDRFAAARVTWEGWSRLLEPLSLVLLLGGFVSFLRMRRVASEARILLAAYTAVSLVFAFGWIVGIQFYYTRALHYLSLPIALGAAALVIHWRREAVRVAVVVVLLAFLGISTLFRAEEVADYYQVLSPATLEAVDWLSSHSEPDDVVVVSTFLGFHMPRLLQRPLMVAMTPELIGNPQEMPVAQDALAVMMGLYNMDEVLDRRQVRFVMLRSRFPDIPSPFRSRMVMEASPRLSLAFSNEDILIYEVLDGSGSDSS